MNSKGLINVEMEDRPSDCENISRRQVDCIIPKLLQLKKIFGRYSNALQNSAPQIFHFSHINNENKNIKIYKNFLKALILLLIIKVIVDVFKFLFSFLFLIHLSCFF